MLCSISFAVGGVGAMEIEAGTVDENPFMPSIRYAGTAAFRIICDSFRQIETLFYRFGQLFSFLYGAENRSVEIISFEWRDEAPLLAAEDSRAFACSMALNKDINFLRLSSDITSWYEYSSDGALWQEVKTNDYFTFVRNKLCQGHIFNDSDNSVKYNYYGRNLIIPAGTKFVMCVTGDASESVASVYDLDEGAVYYIRFCMYARTFGTHTLYKSGPLKCVR